MRPKIALHAERIGEGAKDAAREVAEEEANPKGNAMAGGGDAVSHRQHKPQNRPDY